MKKKKLLALILSCVLVLTLCCGTFATVFGDEADETQTTTNEETIDAEESSEEASEEVTEKATEKATEKTAKILYSGKDGSISWTIDEDGNLVVSPKEEGKDAVLDIEYKSADDTGIPWAKYASVIETAEIEDGVVAGESLSHLFAGNENLKKVVFADSFDTTKTTDMTSMFEDCTKLYSLDLSAFNTKKVTKAENMLRNIGIKSSKDIKVTLGKEFFNMSKDALKEVRLSCAYVVYTVLKDGDKESKPTGKEYSDGIIPLEDLSGPITFIGSAKLETEDDAEDTYTITINANGGVFDVDGKESETTEIKVAKDGYITLDDNIFPKTREGKHMSGWYTDKECTTEFDIFDQMTEDHYNQLADGTVYIGWTDDELYCLVFCANGGKFDKGEGLEYYYEFFYYNDTVDEDDQPGVPAKDGFRFTGKYNKENKEEFEFGKTLSDNYGTLTENKYVIYAEWVETVEVSFDTNGGSEVATKTIDKDSKLDKDTVDTPTKSGYTFDGWYTDDTYKTKFDFSTKMTEDTTLYAKWSKVNKYTVTYYLNGGTLGSNVDTSQTAGVYTITFSGTFSEGETINIAGTTTTLTSTGAESAEKAAAEVCAKMKENTTYTTTCNGAVLTLKGNATLGSPSASNTNSKLTLDTLTPYSSGNTGTVFTDVVTEGKTARNITVSRTGYTFGGWYTSSTFTGSAYNFNTPVKGNVTLYAKWTLNNNNNNNNNNGAKTSDSSNATLWIIIIIAVVVIGGGSIIYLKKRANK